MPPGTAKPRPSAIDHVHALTDERLTALGI